MKSENNNPGISIFLKILLVISIFSLLIVGFFHRITAMTQDLGRHFLVGKIIVETGQVPLTNLFSYTYPNFPFINTHWLSEVIFYLVFMQSGFNGLLIFSTLIILGAFSLIFFYSFKKTTIFALAITSLLYLRILFDRTDIRPEIFSFLFLALFIVILNRYKEKFSWLILFLIPIELLWVNLHIYFIIGTFVLGLFCIDEIITRRKNLFTKRTGILFLITSLSLLATLFNPSGFEGASYPLHVFDNYGYSIEENQSMFFLESLGFDKPSLLYFKISVILLFISLCLSYKKTRPIDWLLALSFTIIGASAVRNLPLFVFATFLPFAITLPVLLQKLVYVLPPIPKRKILYSPYVVTGLLLLLFFWQIQLVQAIKPFGFGVEPGAQRAMDFLQEQQIKGPLFNNFDIGSYLLYRQYPNERVFIDGRPEAYPTFFFKDTYIPMQENPDIFKKISDTYNFNTVFFAHTDMTPWAQTFIQTILENPSWKPVYLDPQVIILLKVNTQNQQVIQEYGMEKNELQMTNLHDEGRNSLLRAINFFRIINNPEKEIPLFQKILKADPNDCLALQELASRYSAHQSSSVNLYLQRYKQHCL